MAEVALDTNVIVGLLYSEDTHHVRARALVARLRRDADALVFFDVLVFEAVSVLCRRAREKKTRPPELAAVLAEVRAWLASGYVRPVGDVDASAALDVVEASGGALNFN